MLVRTAACLLAAYLSAALALAPAARADVLVSATFGGTVDNGNNTDSPPVGTAFQAGQPITGAFRYDATTNTFLSFTIGGYTASPGYTTIPLPNPPLSSTLEVSVGVQNTVANAGPRNNLQINFLYEPPNAGQTANLANFLANPGRFSTNTADGSASYFAAFLNGGATQVDGLLTSYSATLPEPATLLLLAPAAALLVRRRRAA